MTDAGNPDVFDRMAEEILAQRDLLPNDSGKVMLGVRLSPDMRILNLSPTARMGGLQSGDTVTEVDGTPVGSASELANVLAGKQMGDVVSLKVARTSLDGTASTVLLSHTLYFRSSDWHASLDALYNTVKSRDVEGARVVVSKVRSSLGDFPMYLNWQYQILHELWRAEPDRYQEELLDLYRDLYQAHAVLRAYLPMDAAFDQKIVTAMNDVIGKLDQHSPERAAEARAYVAALPAQTQTAPVAAVAAVAKPPEPAAAAPSAPVPSAAAPALPTPVPPTPAPPIAQKGQNPLAKLAAQQGRTSPSPVAAAPTPPPAPAVNPLAALAANAPKPAPAAAPVPGPSRAPASSDPRCQQAISSAVLKSYRVSSRRTADHYGQSVLIGSDLPGSLYGSYSLCKAGLSDPSRAYAMTLNKDGSGEFDYFGQSARPRYPIEWGVLLGDDTEVPQNCHVVTEFESAHRPPRFLPAYVLVFRVRNEGEWRSTFLIDLDGKPVVPGPANSALSKKICPGAAG